MTYPCDSEMSVQLKTRGCIFPPKSTRFIPFAGAFSEGAGNAGSVGFVVVGKATVVVVVVATILTCGLTTFFVLGSVDVVVLDVDVDVDVDVVVEVVDVGTGVTGVELASFSIRI